MCEIECRSVMPRLVCSSRDINVATRSSLESTILALFNRCTSKAIEDEQKVGK
jgi:hypothetical protein